MNLKRKRLSANFAANIYSQLVNMAYLLLTVPLFLTFWSIDLYGEWLVLSALPSYIALSNMGLMNVAQNNMTMAMGAGDTKSARESLHTVWGAQLAINLLVALFLWGVLSFINLADLFNLTEVSSSDARWVVLILSAFAMLNLQAGIFGGIYRAIGQNARGVVAANTIRLLSVGAIAFGLIAGIKSVVSIAGLMGGAYLLGSLFLFWDTAKRAPELRPGLRYFNLKNLKNIVQPGLAFMAYPLGRAVTNQGMLLFVNAFVGSSAVVVLSTLRTVVNTAFQMSNLINMSTWPEFSRMYGAGDQVGVKRLFHFTTALGIWSGMACAIGLWFMGPSLLAWWTRGEVLVDRGLLSVFIIAIIFNATWYTAMTIFNATNRHQKIALIFLASSFLVPIISWILFVIFNLELFSVGVGFLVMEIIMFAVVLPQALFLVGISKASWIYFIIKFPTLIFQKIIKKIRNGNG
ncbi:hypothetical protein BCT07_09670 [Vibrio breoganii]|uniref:lipopolysaccharide biosynthesis protein n=1 Tax=Vibrio breoganii TaxID=553239 RepID=UPI000C818F23|nr:lipopolysaccharide biosynthesis protein [Vibrio breoganii]PMO59269.1 hypothetical protein BCT07_09670 [Vibrio breoganii]